MNQTPVEDSKPIPFRMFIIFGLYSLLFPAVIFPLAGTLRWPMGWWYYGLAVSATIISRLIVARVNPDQLIERGTSLDAENTKSWDRTLSPLVGLVLPVIVLVVCGLDHRWAWSPPFPEWIPIIGILLILLGYLLATWAFVVNKFFSGVVRIQFDRGHYVVTGGPYAFVRHPGYLGGLLSILGTPLLLTSLWGYIPAVIYMLVLILRTALEDRALIQELPGYQEFSHQTRFRLIPGIW